LKSREQELASLLVRMEIVSSSQTDRFAARLETLEGDAVRALKELDIPDSTIEKTLSVVFPVGFSDDLTHPNPADLKWAMDIESHLSGRAVFPYSQTDDSYSFLLYNLFLTEYQSQLEELLGKEVHFIYCPADLLAEFFKEQPKSQTTSVEAETTSREDTDPESPIIKAVNLLFLDALNEEASDVHIEPFENELQVRFRIDGVLRLVKTFPAELQPAVLSRVKLMADMNISEKRVPQDGRIKFQVLGADYDMRVSTLPTVHGETAVLRLLKKESISIDLGKSGFTDDNLRKFRNGFGVAHGICLVTGPTGSGKTTTLYGAVSEINDVKRKIFTIEDPVEYQLDGIVQIPVNAKIGMTFAAGLRAALRQDPDIIMIGEIRDSETATIAVKAALTGHLVLATLHTNSAPGTISRLLDMGTDPFMLATTVEVVLAQRLQRRICSNCRVEKPVTDEAVYMFKKAGLEVPDKIFEGKGCEICGKSGYKGRLGVHEILVVNGPLRDAIGAGASEVELCKLAAENGMLNLRQDSLIKVAEGSSTIDETIRVTGAEQAE
jgi:type II secretory ATPase GspE/PulE/Tfp pilus assembly ATPase PilB-like protein